MDNAMADRVTRADDVSSDDKMQQQQSIRLFAGGEHIFAHTDTVMLMGAPNRDLNHMRLRRNTRRSCICMIKQTIEGRYLQRGSMNTCKDITICAQMSHTKQCEREEIRS